MLDIWLRNSTSTRKDADSKEEVINLMNKSTHLLKLVPAKQGNYFFFFKKNKCFLRFDRKCGDSHSKHQVIHRPVEILRKNKMGKRLLDQKYDQNLLHDFLTHKKQQSLHLSTWSLSADVQFVKPKHRFSTTHTVPVNSPSEKIFTVSRQGFFFFFFWTYFTVINLSNISYLPF